MSLPRPQRLFVTGGRGRLASLVADHFRAPAFAVTLFSRAGGAGFRAFDELARPDTLAGADAIFHLAWSTLPATSEQAGGAEAQVDLPALEKILGTLAAVPAASRPQFIFFSSGGAVYGNAPGRPSVETDACRPVGQYGRAKLAAEELIGRLAAQHGLPCTILRVSNPYGYPVPSSRVQGLIPHVLRCGVSGQPLTVWGDGSARKDFLYYTDFLSALDLVLDRGLTGTFNLSAGESHRVDEVIGLAERELGRPVALQHTAAPAWDVHDSLLANDKFVAATGWRPQVSLAEGIRRAAAGYAGH